MKKISAMPAFALAIVGAILAGCTSNERVYTAENYIPAPPSDETANPAPAGGFSLAIGDETLSAEEVIMPHMEHFRPAAQQLGYQQFYAGARGQIQQLVSNEINSILIYQKARRRLGSEMDKQLERTLDAETRRFIDNFGGNYAEAEEELSRMGMDWQSLREYQKRMIITQSYVSSKISKERNVTYRELRDRYESVKDRRFALEPQVEFSLIEFNPEKIEPDDPNVTSQEKARQMADKIRLKLDEGENFEKLAVEYSHDIEAESGGRWPSRNPEALAQPYEKIAKKALELEESQIAGPIELQGRFFIVRLESKQTKTHQPFAQVQHELEQEILEQRRNEQLNRLAEETAGDIQLEKKQKFIDYTVARLYELCRQ